MWTKPGYHPPEQRPQSAPPEPSGVPVATLERPGGRFGPDSELRLTVEEFKGSRYVNLMVWGRRPDGVMAPTTKRLSVKCRELLELADALRAAARIVGYGEQKIGPAGPRRTHQRQGSPPRQPQRMTEQRQGGLPLDHKEKKSSAPWDTTFDEFTN